MKNKPTGFDYFLIVFLTFIAFITLYPFLNVLAISFNDATDTIRNINFLWPRQWTLHNYEYVFQEKELISSAVMSVSRTVVGTLTGVLSSAMVAYVLSRQDFVFKKLFTIMFIITMYVGGGLIPDYLLIIRTLGLGNKFLVYILPGLLSTYNMILIRSFIEGLPYSLQESAMLDGANDFRIWYKIVLPLCKPVIATIALFCAVGQWNAFMDTYLYAKQLPTLQYKLYEIMSRASMRMEVHSGDEALAQSITPMSIRMAVTIVATVPILIVYPFVQKYFVGGMTLGAVKN